MKKILRYCKGNALTEFSVLALVMVPAFTLLPTIGKISDMNQSTVQASRYAAWERTVSNPSEKSDAQISTEVSNRFFRRMDVKIESDDGVLSEDEFGNTFWSETVEGEKESLLPDANLSIVTRNNSMPGVGSALSDAIISIGSAMGGIVPDSQWDLEDKGFYTAEVSLNIDSTNPMLAGDCNESESSGASCIRRHTAILVDGWTSSSPGETEDRVRSLVPGGALEPLGEVISIIGFLPLFTELGKMKGMFGHVEPDVLPLDRYGD